MAWSGAGAQYFERAGTRPGGAEFNAAWSVHARVRAASLPSGVQRSILNIRGTAAARTPDNAITWDHPTAGFRRSAQNRAGSSGGAYGAAAATSSAAVDTWFSFTGTYDGTSVRLYVDGVLEATTAIAPSTAIAETRITLMNTPDLTSGWAAGTQFSDGQVAECAVWTATLTADEAASLGKGFRPPRIRPQSLFFYAPRVRDTHDMRGEPLTSFGAGAVTDHPRVFG